MVSDRLEVLTRRCWSGLRLEPLDGCTIHWGWEVVVGGRRSAIGTDVGGQGRGGRGAVGLECKGTWSQVEAGVTEVVAGLWRGQRGHDALRVGWVVVVLLVVEWKLRELRVGLAIGNRGGGSLLESVLH